MNKSHTPIPRPSIRAAGPVLSGLVLALTALTSLPAMAGAPSCAIQLSETAIDYGQVARMALLEREHQGKSDLDERTVTLTATCDDPARIGIAYDADAQSGEADSTLRITQALLDGKPVQLVSTQHPDRPLTQLHPGDRIRPRTQDEGQQLSLQLEVHTVVNTAAAHSVRGGQWRNTSTFQVYTD